MNQPATQVTPTNTRLCKHCLTSFEFKRSTAEFCCDACRKAYKRQQERSATKKRLYRAESSPFFTNFLAQECKRAGTIQVLQGHTLDSLLELHAVYALRLRGNLFGSVDTYSICHIFPVAHPTHIGLLHGANLVVAPKKLNQEHRDKFLGRGRSIPRMDLLPCWCVAEDTPIKTIVGMVIEYLGEALVAKLAVKAKLQPSQRQKVMMWLQACGDERVPSLEALEGMTTQKLSQLQSQIKGSKEGCFSAGDNASCIEPVQMAARELARLAKHHPELLELEPLFAEWAGQMTAALNRLADMPHFPAELGKMQFDVLHGACVEDFLSKWQGIQDAKREAAKWHVWTAEDNAEFSLPF